jgi:hypothetical protein
VSWEELYPIKIFPLISEKRHLNRLIATQADLAPAAENGKTVLNGIIGHRKNFSSTAKDGLFRIYAVVVMGNGTVL